MTFFLVPLYLLVIPYIGLMIMVIVGMFRAQRRPYSDDLPSVTVVIPAHNEEDKLGSTLESLSRQRYAGAVEFVIVNDRSVDATGAIIDRLARKDARFRRLDVETPSRRYAPKVNAVDHGIQNSHHDIIITSDADCLYPEGWIHGLVSHFEPDVAMVIGHVETTRPGDKVGPVQYFEAIDWLSLMLTARSLTHFGWKFASTANNQAYRRSAFEAIGGFGAGGRAPSGDEDVLTQRIGRLEGTRVVFASSPDSRVLTQPMPSLYAFLNQRRRWVSRYHHVLHYHPAFLASIGILGFQSMMLSLGVLLTPFFPALAPYVFGLWAVKLAVEFTGMYIGTGQLERRDLWGWQTVMWALLHPFFIATISIWSFIKSGEWKAGAQSYRRRFFKRQWREWRRKVKSSLVR